jgi:haloacetate dehalogenase
MVQIMNEVRHHTIRANGIRHHYAEAGEGAPIILLHGFPETSYAWRHQIPVLAKTYRVIAPDLRGYGETEKPASGYDKRTMASDVRELMRVLDLPRIALVGHDRGARVATRFAKDHADVLDRLVVMDNVPTRIVAREFNARLARAFSDWCYNPHAISGEAFDTYVRAYRSPGAVRGALADYRANAEDVAQDILDADVKIACPTLSLWGADFYAVGQMFDMAAVWAEMADDLRTFAVPQCGHLPQEEQPEIVNQLLLEFLAGWQG